MRSGEHAGMGDMGDMAGMADMSDMVEAPGWVTALGWTVTGLGAVAAAVVLADIYLRRHRQPVAAMEAVWAITTIYAGPLALWAYYRWGRPATARWQQRSGRRPDAGPSAVTVVQTLPGGAASFIGHGIAVPIVMGTGMTIAGRAVWPMILLIAVFALPLLIAFEYRVLSQAGQIESVGRRLVQASRTSVSAIVAFDAGMGAIMLLVSYVLHYGHTTMAFWLLMWAGMLLGFATAYPIVWWLAAAGRRRQAVELS